MLTASDDLPLILGGGQHSVLPRWDDTAINVLLEAIGAATPYMLELRHRGGALTRPPAAANAVGHRDAQFNVFTTAYPGPGFADAAARQAELHQRLLPWSGGRMLYNFAASPGGQPADARQAFDEPGFTRLSRVKTEWDPGNMFRFNVNISPPGSPINPTPSGTT